MPALPRRRIHSGSGQTMGRLQTCKPGYIWAVDSCSRLVAHGVRGPRSRSGTGVSPSFLRSPRRPAATLEYRSVSRNPPFGCGGDWRRHHRSPAVARRPAGQDSARAIRARNGDSSAPFAPESQSFLDHLVASFSPIRVEVGAKVALSSKASLLIPCLHVRGRP
jgi:hypothetical protein